MDCILLNRSYDFLNKQMLWTKKKTLSSYYLKYLFSLFIVFVFIYCPSSCGTDRFSDSKKFRILTDNVVVEGSLQHGGIQPNYLIDLDSPEFDRIFEYADRLDSQPLSYWQKIEKLSFYLKRYVLPNRAYDSTPYLEKIEKYQKSQLPIPLSEYIKCRAGVCREYSMIMHFLLKRIGVPNYHVYAEIRRASHFYDFDLLEDHGFIVLEHQNKNWVIDPYYWGFHGFTLEQLLRPEGITQESIHAPIAKPGPGLRRIVKVHDFPKVWPAVPENCSTLLSHLGSQSREH